MGLLDYNTSDGRFLFMLPWMGHTLVGTTDKKSPAETLPTAPEDEVEWLLKECSKYLSPHVHLRRSDVLSSWRGWRPLAVDPHAPPDAPVSRDHIISENPDTGVIFIAGGKWTTWREMAQDVVDRVVGSSGPKCTTLDVKLFGGEGYTKTLSIELIQKYGMPLDVAEHFVRTYGARSWEVCEQVQPSDKKSDTFETRLAEGFPYLDIDVVWACREYACTIEDVLSRRTRLAFLNKEAALQAIPLVADIMAKELGWSSRVKKQQIAAAEKYIGSYGGRIS
jgi:glycerol-3-phosphate dehydrogenase